MGLCVMISECWYKVTPFATTQLPSKAAAPDGYAQCRGWRDAGDVIEAIGATPIENLGTAIAAVGPRAKIAVLGQ